MHLRHGVVKGRGAFGRGGRDGRGGRSKAVLPRNPAPHSTTRSAEGRLRDPDAPPWVKERRGIEARPLTPTLSHPMGEGGHRTRKGKLWRPNSFPRRRISEACGGDSLSVRRHPARERAVGASQDGWAFRSGTFHFASLLVTDVNPFGCPRPADTLKRGHQTGCGSSK